MPSIEEWIAGETKDGKSLPLEMCNAYRSYRNLPALERALITRGSPESAKPPGIVRLATNFAKSAAKHVAAGMPKASQFEIDARLAICRGCEKFNGTRCTVCGCGCSAKTAWNNKLSWANEVCPHPNGPKWGPISKGTDE